MITVEVVVRDDSGRRVDLARVGVAELVALIRARPLDPPPGDPGPPDPAAARAADRARSARVWGGGVLSLDDAEAASRQLAAVRAACVAAVGDDCPDGLAGDRAVDELACALLVSGRSARHTRDTAETIRAVPDAWAALARGALDQTRARILAEAVLDIPRHDPDGAPRRDCDAERAALLADGLPYAAEHTARRLALFLRRRLAAMGCAATTRRRRALAQRGVWVSHDGEGTADLTARLSSEDAERVYAVIRTTALADRNGDPAHDATQPREPLGTWLAAAFVDLTLGNHSPRRVPGTGDPGTPAALPPSRVQTVVNVTIPIDSLAGLSDQPGQLNGFGILPAHVARRLAGADARWRHILTARTTGAILDVGTLSYRPPAALDRHVRLRDGTCRFPGCQVPARECDLDHLVPFPVGPTSAGNLHALCRRHHGLKHDHGWHVEALPGSALRWTSPQGATATTWPADTLHRIA